MADKKLIASSTSEDLRKKDWKLESSDVKGDIVIQIYITPEEKKLEVRTRFCDYDSFDGRPEIISQMVYEI